MQTWQARRKPLVLQVAGACASGAPLPGHAPPSWREASPERPLVAKETTGRQRKRTPSKRETCLAANPYLRQLLPRGPSDPVNILAGARPRLRLEHRSSAGHLVIKSNAASVTARREPLAPHATAPRHGLRRLRNRRAFKSSAAFVTARRKPSPHNTAKALVEC